MQVSTGLPMTSGDVVRTSVEAQTAGIAVDAMETDHHSAETTAYDTAVLSGKPVVLKAIANDADFDLIQFNWRQLTGPTVTIADTGSATISFTAPEVFSTKELIFELAADDGRDVISSIVTFTVTAVAAKPDEDLQHPTCSLSWLAFLFGSLFIS